MPLRLNVGLQQKKGLPHYGSLGAACHLELELEASLLERDPEEFHKQVAAAFAICRDAVAEELARPANECSTHESNGADRDPVPPAVPTVRLATGKQIRALQALAARCGFDLAAELEQRYGVSIPDELPRVQASCVIREWNAAGCLGDREHRWNGSKHAK